MRSILSSGLMALALLASTSAFGASSLEYPVKATYLYKFAPFVTWPDVAFTAPNSPFVICVLGDDPFGPVLDQAISSQRVGARAIAIRRLEKVDKGSGCQILYVGGSRVQSAADALASVRGAPVLTVTDAARTEPPGVIHFVVQDNRVRFQIDDQAAAQNGLSISSKLLSLAVSVRPRT